MKVLPPTSEHTHTAILLHGRGSTATEFISEFLLESQATNGDILPQIFPGFRWVVPKAPVIYSEQFRTDMSQWYDKASTLDPHLRESEQNLEPSIERIRQVIEDEAKFIGLQNIIVLGISQGCAVGIHVLLRHFRERPLGGFVGLCSWMPKPDSVKDLKVASTPVFLSHSRDDETIAFKYGEELRDCLRQLGLDVEWHSYPDGGHWVNEPTGIHDIAEFIRRITERQIGEAKDID